MPDNTKQQLPIFIGFFIWLLLCICRTEYSFLEWSHVEILVLAAPLFLVPMLLLIYSISATTQWISLIGAIFLAISYQLPQGWIAASMAACWLVFTLLLAFRQIRVFQRKPNLETEQISLLAASIYLPVGAAWAVADRLGFQPMGFRPIIVLLTAAHFHYAGFIVPFLYALAAKYYPKSTPKWLAFAAILGVPSVAIGITISQLGLPQWLETGSVFPMVIGGFGLGIIHFRLAFQKKINFLNRALWSLAGLALCSGMVLAFLYGIRNWLPLDFLTIPWMYAVHGTLNAVGFAMPAVFGWSYSINTASLPENQNDRILL